MSWRGWRIAGPAVFPPHADNADGMMYRGIIGHSKR
jgi:hypothetical protein